LCYAVTDLDGNGQLEILSSETHGTGHIPTFRAWEVDESGTSIVSIAEPDEQGSTVIMGASSYNAEYLSIDTVDKFFDSANSRSYYIQTSEVKDGTAHYRETKFAISLENGKMEQDIGCWWHCLCAAAEKDCGQNDRKTFLELHNIPPVLANYAIAQKGSQCS